MLLQPYCLPKLYYTDCLGKQKNSKSPPPEKIGVRYNMRHYSAVRRIWINKLSKVLKAFKMFCHTFRGPGSPVCVRHLRSPSKQYRYE